MWVKTPGQYNSSITVVVPPKQYTRYFDKELGVFLPIYNDDSEDSYFLKDNSNDVPEDPNYHPKYDESDNSFGSSDKDVASECNGGHSTSSNNEDIVSEKEE